MSLQKKANLLVVDDSSTILSILESTALQLGTLKPHLARSFYEAGQLVQQIDFDVAILDLDLPDAHQGEVIDLAIGHGIPSIVLTGTYNETLRAEVLSKPIADYIVKSNLAEIRNAVFMAENLAMFKNKQVLVVDDSKVSRTMLRNHFLSLNFNIFTAADGKEALEIISKHPNIDLITVDYEMPGMNGVEFIQSVKAIMKIHTPIIIGVCASSSENTIVQFLKSGANDVFSKPLIKEMLNLKIANIMKLLRQQKELLTSQKITEEYQKAFSAGGLISKADIDGNITFINDEFCAITGYTAEEVLGESHSIFRHPQTPKATFKEMWETILAKKTWRGVLCELKKDGSSFYANTTIVPILDIDDTIVEFVAIRDDATQLVENRNALKLMFYNDSLTGLGNRHKLLLDIKDSENAGLAIIDIKDFKMLNSTFGSKVGDMAIREFSDKLFECFDRKIYALYHIGADQFAVTTNIKFEYEKQDLEGRVRLCIDKLKNVHFCVEDQEINLSARTGISYDCQDISQADMALKYAKDTGMDFVVFTEALRLTETYKKTYMMIKKIKRAIANDRFVPYFQPMIRNSSGKIEKFECLIRMIDEDGLVVMPIEFLDIAKKSGLYLSLTKIMLQKCIEAFAKTKYEFTINVTVEDILNRDINELIINSLDISNCAKRAVFEIVESEGIESAQQVSEFLENIRTLGAKLAIDDFGTGYSNFDYFIKLKADFIKIDGSLIEKIAEDEHVYQIVKTIVGFAKTNNYKTIAEYVSSKEILDKVVELGIDYSQGFYISKPKPMIQDRVNIGQ